MSVMFFNWNGDRPLASVRLYASLHQGACNDRSIAALQACARHKQPRRKLALRIEADLPTDRSGLRRYPWCVSRGIMYRGIDAFGCSNCEVAAVTAAVDAARRVIPSAAWRGCRGMHRIACLYLFPAPLTARQVKRASRARDAAARKLARLGYVVHVTDDDGGTTLLKPRAKWKRAKSCDLEHVRPRGSAPSPSAVASWFHEQA